MLLSALFEAKVSDLNTWIPVPPSNSKLVDGAAQLNQRARDLALRAPDMTVEQIYRSFPEVEHPRDQGTRNDPFRKIYTTNYAWCIISKEVIDAIKEYKIDGPIYDVMAGTGYISHVLKQRGLPVKSADIMPPGFSGRNEYRHKAQFVDMKKTDATALVKAIDKPINILMSWPPYDHPIGYSIVQSAAIGSMIFYIGEWIGGCTGTHSMFKLLMNACEEVANVIIPQFTSSFGPISDGMQVFRKTKQLDQTCGRCGDRPPEHGRMLCANCSKTHENDRTIVSCVDCDKPLRMWHAILSKSGQQVVDDRSRRDVILGLCNQHGKCRHCGKSSTFGAPLYSIIDKESSGSWISADRDYYRMLLKKHGVAHRDCDAKTGVALRAASDPVTVPLMPRNQGNNGESTEFIRAFERQMKAYERRMQDLDLY